jgi:hypothetical protein
MIKIPLLGEYVNGNYRVYMGQDGTKIRETLDKNATEWLPEFPENLDVHISDYCPNNCEFCYANCSINGKHGELLDNEFIDSLKPYTEVALNGNDLSHPQLEEFLIRLKKLKVIANITINQIDFMREHKKIKLWLDDQLIWGLGVSLTDPSENFISTIKQFPTAVIHVITGIVKIEDLKKLKNHNLKVLILGYKKIGKGKIVYSPAIRNKQAQLQRWIKKIINENWFKVISWDNLGLYQLRIKRHLTPEQWKSFYMGADGHFTFFIDLVKRKFAPNSLDQTYWDISNKNIVEMFKQVRSYSTKKADIIFKEHLSA